MPRTTTLHAVTAIGIDMGKNTLHLIGLDARGDQPPLSGPDGMLV
jgi:hypothetical protein